MKVPEIFLEETIAVFRANQVSYSLVYKLNHGWVRYLDGDVPRGKFDAALPPEHIFDADLLADSLDDVDESIREELGQLVDVCIEWDCRYFKFDFDDYELMTESED
jgi:hypothetical protein